MFISSRYWRIWQYIHISYAYPFCWHSEITNQYWPNRQQVLAKSLTGIGQIAYPYGLNCQLVSLVYNSINTGWRFGQYRLVILECWQKGYASFICMYCRIRQYRLAIWPIPFGNLANTGWQFGQYQLAIWSIPVGDLVEIGDSKNMGGLRIMPRYGIKNKKNRFGSRSVPLRTKQ